MSQIQLKFGQSFISELTYCLLAVHALVEVFKLKFAFSFGPSLAYTMSTLDPLLLEGMTAGDPLLWLLPTLGQEPLVQINAQL